MVGLGTRLGVGSVRRGRGASSTLAGRSFGGVTSLRSASRIGEVLRGASIVTALARVRVPAYALGTVLAVEINNLSAGLTMQVTATGKVFGGGRSQSGDSFQSVTGVTSVALGTWALVGVTLDIGGDTAAVYLNGALDASASVAFGASTWTLAGPTQTDKIGENTNPAAAQFFVGDIADVAFFRRALTSGEWADIAAGTRPDQINGIGPCAYFPLSPETDGAGAFAYSRMGNLVLIPNGVVPASTSAAELTPLPAPRLDRFRGVRVLRLSSADAASVGEGQKVASVTLRQGGVALLQTNAANQPDFVTVDGRKTLSFVTADADVMSAALGSVSLSGGVAVVAIGDFVTGRILSQVGPAGTGSSENDGFAFSATEGLIVGNGGGLSFATYSDYAGGRAILSGRYSGKYVENWLNGVKRTSASLTNCTALSDGTLDPSGDPTGPTTAPLLVGGRSSGTPLNLTAHVHEIAVIIGAVTDEELRYIEAVLAWESGNGDLLPVGNPWHATAPTAASDIAYPWGSGVVARSPTPRTQYLGSPSLLRTASGKVYLMHDQFSAATGRLYASDGEKGGYGIADFPSGMFWPTIWEHTDGNLYILHFAAEFGNIVLKKSTNGGLTWTSVTLSTSGGPVPAASGSYKWHRAGGLKPLYHDGYLFFGLENQPGAYFDGFLAHVLYAPEGADLMAPGNWKSAGPLARGTTGGLANRTQPSAATPGFLEGNICADDAGQLWYIARFSGSTTLNKCLRIPLGWDGSTITMPAWSADFIVDCPVGTVKFEMVRHGAYYYALGNTATTDLSATSQDQRVEVALYRTPGADLSTFSWEMVDTVLTDADLASGMSDADNVLRHGVQYPSFDIAPDGTVRALYRVAVAGSDTFHNSNLIGVGKFSLPA